MERELAGSSHGTPAGDAIAISPEVKRSVRLLIVEDDRTLREGLALTLRAEGYAVTTAGSGEQAQEALERAPFEIVITDLHLAAVSGLDVLRAAHRLHPGVIVIVITGDPSLPACLAAVRNGAWDCLPKPFSANHLHSLLERAVRHVATRAEAGPSNERERLVVEFERAYLGRLVRDAGGNLERAARLARVDRGELDELLLRHGLHRAR